MMNYENKSKIVAMQSRCSLLQMSRKWVKKLYAGFVNESLPEIHFCLNIQMRRISRLVAIICIVIFVVFSISCTNPETAVVKKNYFDLTGFLDKEISRLYKDSFIVVKTTSINNSMDQHEMPWTDWRKEFALFYGSDINKSAYAGKYAIDTLEIDSLQRKIVYSSTDSALRTRILEVTYELPVNEVTLIYVRNYSHNAMITNSEDLYFESGATYIIKTKRRLVLFGETTFAVKGDLVKKQHDYF